MRRKKVWCPIAFGLPFALLVATVLGDFGQIGSQRLTVNLDGADDCDLQGSRYVRAKATLWDGSGNVEAFVDQQGSGAVLGTSVTKGSR